MMVRLYRLEPCTLDPDLQTTVKAQTLSLPRETDKSFWSLFSMYVIYLPYNKLAHSTFAHTCSLLHPGFYFAPAVEISLLAAPAPALGCLLPQPSHFQDCFLYLRGGRIFLFTFSLLPRMYMYELVSGDPMLNSVSRTRCGPVMNRDCHAMPLYAPFVFKYWWCPLWWMCLVVDGLAKSVITTRQPWKGHHPEDKEPVPLAWPDNNRLYGWECLIKIGVFLRELPTLFYSFISFSASFLLFNWSFIVWSNLQHVELSWRWACNPNRLDP